MTGFTKRRLRIFLIGAIDGAQQALEETPIENKLRMSRNLGKREALEGLLDVLDENVIEKAAAQRQSKSQGGAADGDT